MFEPSEFLYLDLLSRGKSQKADNRIIKFIEENNIDINIQFNKDMRVPNMLFACFYNEKYNLIHGGQILPRYLVEKGIDIELVNRLGQNVLSLAIHAGNTESIELFIKKGVSLHKAEELFKNEHWAGKQFRHLLKERTDISEYIDFIIKYKAYDLLPVEIQQDLDDVFKF